MPEQPAPRDNAPKQRSRRPLLIAAAGALLAAGAGAAWWTTQRAPAANGDQTVAARTDSVFLPLEQFTVNLADEGGERFAQLSLTLEVADGRAEAALKARMPAIRNAILLLLSSMTSADLLTVAGKQKLAAQIARIAARELGWQAEGGPDAPGAAQPRKASLAQGRPNPVLAVHFSHFIVQ
ncbi:MAG: flagellar basal body-associated FliL family protein [Burkholderiales bacterium]|jgi:flagellar FliL protein|nr:flagellar basal body-associated FliL family protein [Burkholderiales bacterium]HMM51118.1 flagellar basal body-associated FliL family protein [Burkholderiaceae bacterium]